MSSDQLPKHSYLNITVEFSVSCMTTKIYFNDVTSVEGCPVRLTPLKLFHLGTYSFQPLNYKLRFDAFI